MFHKKTSKQLAILFIALFAGCNSNYNNSRERTENERSLQVSELSIASVDSSYIDYSNTSMVTDRPRNIILIIGDGMGINQVLATRYRYYGVLGKLYMERLPVMGMVNTSADGEFLITCSAAAGSAMATGKKTINGMVGMDKDSIENYNLTEVCYTSGMALGFITTGKLAGGTPGAFFSHAASRDMKTEIARQIVEGNADLLFGESEEFMKSSDLNEKSVLNIALDLGYEVQYNKFTSLSTQEKRQLILFDSIVFENQSIKDGLLVHNPETPRLPVLTTEAIHFLNKRSDKGFFLVIEEDQIDSWGHENNLDFITWHVKNLDDAVKNAMDFAIEDKETLIVITSDHETGGLNIIDARKSSSNFKAVFSTDDHTAQPVPLYSFGPGSFLFQGTIENTEIFEILKPLLNK